jgi:hypothetical protein
MALKWLLVSLVHFSWDIKHVVGTRWLANPNQGYSHFFHNFQSSYECLIHYQYEDS